MTTTRIETLSLTDGRELRVTIAEPDSAVRAGSWCCTRPAV